MALSFLSDVLHFERKPDPRIPSLQFAIGKNETRGEKDPHSFSRPSGSKVLGDALGKYQVTEGELATYAERFLGRPTTRTEFLSNPDMQERYMRSKLQFLTSKGLDDEQVLAAHRGGFADFDVLPEKVEQFKGYVQKGIEFAKSFNEKRGAIDEVEEVPQEATTAGIIKETISEFNRRMDSFWEGTGLRPKTVGELKKSGLITTNLEVDLKQPDETPLPEGISFIDQFGVAAPIKRVGTEVVRAAKEAGAPIVETALSKLVAAVKNAGKSRQELERAFTEERARRAGEVSGVFEQQAGQKGFFGALSKLKGELVEKKPDFEELKLQQTDVDALFNQVQGFERLDVYERISAASGLQNLLEGRIPQQSQLSLLEDVFGKELVEAVLEKRPLLSKIGDTILDLINIPRALITSADMSAPLRQGIIFTLSKPITSSGAFKEMFKQAFSQKNFDAWMENLPKHPLFKEMRDSKLYIANFKKTPGLAAKEERFMTNLAQKIPVWGAVVRAAERAYVGFLNKMRVDVYTQLSTQMRQDGIATPDNLSSLANYINNATGRGSLGKAEPVAQFLNNVFFSPRLIASRFNMLNPIWYAQQTPFVRKEAIKNMAKFIGSGMSILGLAAGAGADVELDPRSTDFGKIRIGDTRFDIWGGFQQWVRVFTQLLSGQRKSTKTGDIIELSGKEYPFTSRYDVAERFLLGKLSPMPSLATELMRGQKIFGGDIVLTEEIAENSIPLYLQDMMEAIDEFGPEGIFITGIPAFFGVGVQTYTEKKGASKMTF